jgi:hypothetical protein
MRGFEDGFYKWLLWWMSFIGGFFMLATHLVAGNARVTKFERVNLQHELK